MMAVSNSADTQPVPGGGDLASTACREPRTRRRRAICGAVLLLATLSAGCATAPDPTDREAYREYEELNDPLEPFNRAMFFVNRALDTWFLQPFSEFYRGLVPPPIQRGVTNFLRNLRSPVILANNLLQGEPEEAGNTLTRMLVNTTLGVGGLDDPAKDFGYPFHDEDFGQTLAVWGVGDGPFLMLPLLGPSNPRDASGLAVDSFLIDPIGLMTTLGNEELQPYQYARFGLTVVDARARNTDAINEINRSLDPYAAMRSFYRQYRAAEIRKRGAATEEEAPSAVLPEIPDIPD